MPPKKRNTKRQDPARSIDTPKTTNPTPSSPKSSQLDGNASSTHVKMTTRKTKRTLDADQIGQLPSKRTKTGAPPRTTRSDASRKPIDTSHKRSKVNKTQHPRSSRSSVSPQVINQPPTKILTVIAFGNGESGELGLGPSVTETVRPRISTALDPNDPSKFHVVQLDCGGMHTVGLTIDNKIISWGVNDKGALGRNTVWDGGLRDIDEDASDASGDLNPRESTPAEVPETSFPSGTRFVQVAAGDSCSFALTDTGLVYGWGTFRDPEGKYRFSLNANGAVVEMQPKPTIVSGLAKITQITCGTNHALALDITGDIWAWGSGEQNQLGRRLLGRRHLECLIPSRVGVCRKNAKFIASGEYHSFAIDRKDNVWAWGLNSFGEAGYAEAAGSDSVLLPYPMKVRDLCGQSVVSLDGVAHHSVAVTADGKCLAWGRMDCGQLGIDFTPEQLEDTSLLRYDERDKPRICLRPVVVSNIGKVVHACCGTDHTIFINEDGKAYSTGFGTQGQLGLGSCDDVQVAQPIGGKATKERTLIWAGAGGQFSMITALTKLVNSVK